MQDLVCISHLRWDFVWQRPQQLLSRLAQHGRVLFVEEPVTDTDATEPWLETYPGRGDNPVTVARLRQPAPDHYWIGHNDPQTQAAYASLLKQYLADENYRQPNLWLYTPLALPFTEVVEPDVLIYDVMDELSAFKGAPVELREFDRRALNQADVVFTGGLSLYRARQPYTDKLHLFPSGVEIEHFARAVHRAAFVRLPDLAAIAAPILGYFGVIDERMDLALLAELAQSHPEWNLVLVGPVIKIAPDELPQAPNLHYVGMKDYQELPAYLAYFDVALVPFALNDATRYLSPTKTLEYLAAHKPVVATPIPDIVELYGEYVRIGHTPAEFVKQVAAALAESATQRTIRQRKEQELLRQYTWDQIADRMYEIIRGEAANKDRSE